MLLRGRIDSSHDVQLAVPAQVSALPNQLPLDPAQIDVNIPQIISVSEKELAAAKSGFFRERSRLKPMTPLPFGGSGPIFTNPILCRICESQIPQWYFEMHNETCAETHRCGAEISECNDSIAELCDTLRDLCATIGRNSPNIPEYRVVPIFSPSTSPTTARQLLGQLEDILQVAAEISVPAFREEEAKEPIERQRLLSPESERKVSQVRNWSKPTTEDATLSQLVQDAECMVRQKLDNVARMQNAIRYEEKLWHKWEELVGQYPATLDESSSTSSSRPLSSEPEENMHILQADIVPSRIENTHDT